MSVIKHFPVVKKSSFKEEEYVNIEAYFTHQLDGADYESGMLEETQNTVNNTVAALGRLVQVLHYKKVLTDLEVAYIAEEHVYDEDDEEKSFKIRERE